QFGAAGLLVAAIGLFAIFLLSVDDRPQRFLEEMKALYSVPFRDWVSIAELTILIATVMVLNAKTANRTLRRLDEESALTLRDNPQQGFRGRLVRSALGVPRIVDYLPSRRTSISALFVLANALYAIS